MLTSMAVCCSKVVRKSIALTLTVISQNQRKALKEAYAGKVSCLAFVSVAPGKGSCHKYNSKRGCWFAEVQAFGPATKEDSCHQESFDTQAGGTHKLVL